MIDPKQITLKHMALNHTEQTRHVSRPDIDIISFDLGPDGQFNIRGYIRNSPETASDFTKAEHERRIRVAELLTAVCVKVDGTFIEERKCNPKYIHEGLAIVDGEIIGQAYAPLTYVSIEGGTHAEVVRGRAWVNEVQLSELGWVCDVKKDLNDEPYFVRLELK